MDFSTFKETYGVRLNPQQEQAVCQTDRPTLLLAVPGSGKTTVLVTRLGYLLYGRGVAPEKTMTMTYTVAASRDMRRRFQEIFGEELADRLAFRTINGVCASIIQRYVNQGRQGFTLLENNGPLLRDLYLAQTNNWPTPGDVKELQRLVTYIKNMRLGPEEISELKLNDAEVGPLYEAYQAEMRARRQMDYDDQMVYAYSILRRAPDILAYFQKRCAFLSVDEAQDTSKIQHEVIRLLAGTGQGLFLVGDEDQSIYRFRAAYPEALLRFEQDYPGGQVLLLEENFRSTQTIVSAADRFIAQNRDRRQKHMVTQRPQGEPVKRMVLPSRRSQYRILLNWLQKAEPKETAILYRNNDSAIPLIDELDRRGQGYRSRQLESLFFTSSLVTDVKDFLLFAQEPGNAAVFQRIYYKMGCNISKEAAQEAVALFRRSRFDTLLQALASLDRVSPRRREKLLERDRDFRALKSAGAREAVDMVRYACGYGAYVLQKGGDMEKFYILSALAAQEKTQAAFLARLEALPELMQAGGSDPESPLTLSTIHASKGLEYDRVVLMDMVDGLLPALNHPEAPDLSREDRTALEEERRLFYVGVTRAKEELVLLSYQARDEGSSFLERFLGQALPKEKSQPPQKTALRPVPKPKAKRKSSRKTSGRKTQEEPWYAPYPLSVTTPAPALTPVSGTEPKQNWDSDAFRPGCRVRHCKFGPGVVTEVRGDVITLDLDSGKTRSFSLSVCVDYRLLEPEAD